MAGPKKEKKDAKGGFNIDLGGTLDGFLGGIGDLVSKLGDLAEKGQELKKSGTIDFSSIGQGTRRGPPNGLKGVYGFSVKVGGQGEGESVSIEPFGNIKKDSSGQTTVEDVHEPIVDIFEEADHIQVVAELPGIDEKDIRLEIEGDMLGIFAERPGKKYHKEVLLPWKTSEEKMTKVCRNGILEIKIEQ